jgi:hypothetical protein
MFVLKKVLASCVILILLLSSCGTKPMYKTREGKRKKKYYDMHQNDRYDRDLVLINGMKKPKKQKNKKKKYKFPDDYE